MSGGRVAQLLVQSKFGEIRILSLGKSYFEYLQGWRFQSFLSITLLLPYGLVRLLPKAELNLNKMHTKKRNILFKEKQNQSQTSDSTRFSNYI